MTPFTRPNLNCHRYGAGPEVCPSAHSSILVVRRLSRQRVAQVQEQQVVVRIPGRSGSQVPGVAEEVRVLEDEAQRSIVRVLPECLIETERGLLDSPVLAISRF